MCIVGNAKNKKFYQYTAIDDYSRFRYPEVFEEHSTYSSALFLEHLIKAFLFPVECVRQITEQSLQNSSCPPTLFETRPKQCGRAHKLIRPYTPRHNGKVERSHRKDNEYFYAMHSFYSFDDFKKQLAVHNRKYNHFTIRPLHWKSLADYIKAYINNGEVF